MAKLFETLKERGYFYQVTDEEAVKNICNGNPATIYVGIDPTANSLHIGHFFALMMLKYFQDAGHKVIVLIGGATAMIGDPTGKSDMRKMLDKKTIENNLNEVKQIIKRFINDDGRNPAIIVNNADWLNKFSYIDFMREIGVHFNVNRMLSCDAYSSRMENGGLTFLEMGYMPMQAYDFVHLNNQYNCILQIGGSDQWANILAGVDLKRKMDLANEKSGLILQGLTCPLLTNSEGKKMGKTEKGTLWVAREKTSVYDFYQYFYNVDDKDVEKLLKLFTRISLEDIDNLLKKDIREAKRRMAYEITKLVHGQTLADEAIEIADNLFKQGNGENAPTAEVNSNEFEESINVVDLLVKVGFTSSKGETRRLIEQGGIYIEDNQIKDATACISKAELEQGILFRRGKKQYLKIIAK